MTHNRRSFLSLSGQGLGAAWLALHWPAISTAATHAHAQAVAGERKLERLSADEARDLEAISAHIIPTDHTPGAREAGVVYFMDAALGGFFAPHRTELHADYQEFSAGVVKQSSGKRFADLSAERQLQVLQQVEGTRFFGTVRLLTVVGFLASPRYGGNRNGVGWQVIGFDDQHVFTPPFGYYDRDYPGFIPYDTKKKTP
jgi:gluconate 2-dehydrogenase gamma chain